MSSACSVEFESWERSVPEILDRAGAPSLLAGQSVVLLKPNLVNASPPPVTTPVEFAAEAVRYVRSHCAAEIVIAEGCGDMHLETPEIFERLGYADMARELGARLLDLNHAPLRTVSNPACPVFPEMRLPEIAFESLIISLPMLKAHSLAGLTGTLKNMMGFAPSEHYSGRGGSWKKAVFHQRMQQSIRDLNAYITPHLTVMDGTVGLRDYHLGGAECSPRVNKLIAGTDPWAVDRMAADLLGLDWRSISHVASGPMDSR